MVRKLCDDGVNYYHEPPYTEAEEMTIYKALDAGPFARTHLRHVGHQSPPRKVRPAPEEQ